MTLDNDSPDDSLFPFIRLAVVFPSPSNGSRPEPIYPRRERGVKQNFSSISLREIASSNGGSFRLHYGLA